MYGGFTLVTLSKARALRARSVSERGNNCFQDGAMSSSFREFSGTCVPLSGRSRPPKNPARGNENLGPGLAKLFKGVFRDLRPLIWPQPATKNPATGNENLSLAKLSEIPAGTFLTIWAFRSRNCEQKFGTDSLVL